MLELLKFQKLTISSAGEDAEQLYSNLFSSWEQPELGDYLRPSGHV